MNKLRGQFGVQTQKKEFRGSRSHATVIWFDGQGNFLAATRRILRPVRVQKRPGSLYRKRQEGDYTRKGTNLVNGMRLSGDIRSDVIVKELGTAGQRLRSKQSLKKKRKNR